MIRRDAGRVVERVRAQRWPTGWCRRRWRPRPAGNDPPAAFGVLGYKPVFERWSTTGVKALAPSLDTIGLLCRDLDDIPVLSAVLTGSPMQAGATPKLRPFLPPSWREARHDVLALLEPFGPAEAAPPEWDGLNAAHRVIMSVEVARALAPEYREHRDRVPRRRRVHRIRRGADQCDPGRPARSSRPPPLHEHRAGPRGLPLPADRPRLASN